ncbi:MAG: ABC transporter transmembrane domain-containing protein [Pseudomonadota bacterium]
MHSNLFAFIWRYSKLQQFVLLAVTLLAFPFLYATLELPKLIINDAIGAESGTVALHGVTLSQVEYLALLCAGFFGAVLAWGLVKMRLNTMKGILAERLLRRFRYQLISRVLRFPVSHFRRTSQGELVSMVTAEAEPLGGIMGDMLAQPVFQAGQMLTILAFLFIQSPWLGLAAVALIPLQAWLIPYLQRQINLLNKSRVQEVRRLSEEIGESVAGLSDLRANGGVPYAQAAFTDRLGRLFRIRLKIYHKKFFMKFINNFITQMTPFLFFSIGGYLAITGDLTVGALVAALAAYKDLSGPWKELLAYYNQVQDMGLRYTTIIEQFAPTGMLAEDLVEGDAPEIPRLNGAIRLENATLLDPDGAAILDGLTAEIPAGATVAVEAKNATERRAFAELLSRGVTASSGRIEVAGHDLAGLHQRVVAQRIGLATPDPYLFNRTIGRNISMSLRTQPKGDDASDTEIASFIEEAERAGNSTEPLASDWLDPSIAEVEDRTALNDWWYRIIQTMQTDMFLFERGLGAQFSDQEHPELAADLVALRPKIRRKIADAGLCKAVHFFEPDKFNPAMAVGGNLLFAAARRQARLDAMAADPRFLSEIEALGLRQDVFALGYDLVSVLVRTFGQVGVQHPLFRKLGIDQDLFEQLTKIVQKKRRKGVDQLTEAERALLSTLPFRLSAEQIGDAFPKPLKQKILELRQRRSETMLEAAGDLFIPLDPERFNEGLTVLENALFGRISASAGAKAGEVVKLVGEVLVEAGLKREVVLLIGDVEAGIGGANLPRVAHERIAFARAVIKRPDILILDCALASHDSEKRAETRRRLRDLLPDSTLIFLEAEIPRRSVYDLVLEISEGSLNGAARAVEPQLSGTAMADLQQKIRILSRTSPLDGLDTEQHRLLAFASSWVEFADGDYLFRHGEPAEGAYVLTEGEAELRWPNARPGMDPVTDVPPGRLIGDLSVIREEPRRLDMIAIGPVKGLRIGAQELHDVVEADPRLAMALLRTVAGYLNELGGRYQELKRAHPELETQ